VRVRRGDQTLTRQVEAGTGEGNQNDLTLHFGLGSHATPVPLEILWPNTSRQVVASVLPDRTISIRFGKSPQDGLRSRPADRLKLLLGGV
jgi:enediyne biosynthesis protein E4